MKTQTNKCHTFSVFLFNQLSLYKQCLWEFFGVRCCVGFPYAATHNTKFPKSNPHKIQRREEITTKINHSELT